ncbi:MAG TPA: hypothetical protein DDW78_05780 [Treponema sp.]|nr:hypothetical protein [Treponema sp.]
MPHSARSSAESKKKRLPEENITFFRTNHQTRPADTRLRQHFFLFQTNESLCEIPDGNQAKPCVFLNDLI